MATTYTEQSETRLYFDFARGNETASRYLSLPGIPEEDSEERTTIINNFQTFRTQVMPGSISGIGVIEDFVQPANWRDLTGSGGSGVDEEQWTTTDVQLEFYTVQKTRITGEE